VLRWSTCAGANALRRHIVFGPPDEKGPRRRTTMTRKRHPGYVNGQTRSPFSTATGFDQAPSPTPLPSEIAPRPSPPGEVFAPAAMPRCYACPPCLARVMQYKPRTLCRIGATPGSIEILGSLAQRRVQWPSPRLFCGWQRRVASAFLQEDQEGSPLRHAGSGMEEPRESGILVTGKLGIRR
jgi:hypothetical protein